MKVGNLSQVISPVPEFFLNQAHQPIDTFYIPPKRKFFREKELISSLSDVNISHNPRLNSRKLNHFNSEKYLPIYAYNQGFSSVKHKDFPVINHQVLVKPLSDNDKLISFMEKTNSSGFLRPKLKDEIKQNLNSLLDKINVKPNIKEWNENDSRGLINNFYSTVTSPLSKAIKRNSKEEFKSILQDKALSLTSINIKAKQNIEAIVERQKIKSERSQSISHHELDKMLNTCRNNLLDLKKHNPKPFDNNEKDGSSYRNIKYIPNKFSRTTLHRNIPISLGFDIKRAKETYKKKKHGHGYINQLLDPKHRSVLSINSKGLRDNIWMKDSVNK